jgi:hypothetical protein
MEALTDTDPEARRVQMELLRRASPERRLRLALSLSRSVLTLRPYMDDGARQLGVADLLARAVAESERE